MPQGRKPLRIDLHHMRDITDTLTCDFPDNDSIFVSDCGGEIMPATLAGSCHSLYIKDCIAIQTFC